ncbi:MAG: recombinase family protein [Candidatus Saccharimonadales bacterium]
MARAGLYLRLSEDKHGDELGVTRQREDCEALAQLRGYDVVLVESDNDLSAKGHVARPGFESVLRAVDEGRVDVIVAYNWDRLTRNRHDTLRLIEQGQRHQTVIALVRGSDMDLSTPAGRMVAGILAEVARNEIDVKSERQIRANKQRAEAGLPHFVSRPYGYTRQAVVVEDEAQVLNQMADHFLSGWSTTEITRWLNDENIPSASGTTWSRRVVKDHLLSKRNAGIRVYKGQDFPATWTPIYSAELHERIVSEWKRRHGEGTRAKADNRRYLLTGLLICGKCQGPMAGGANSDNGQPSRRKYRCIKSDKGAGCGNIMRLAETIEHLVTESVLYRLDSDAMREVLVAQESQAEAIEPLRSKLEAIRSHLDELLEDRATGLLSRAEYAKAKEIASRDLRAIENELAGLYSTEQAQLVLRPGVVIRDEWQRQTLGWQRKLLGMLIENVVVQPSFKRTPYMIDDKLFKFDASAIEINWLY